jgi:hypothetical protein
MQAKSMGIKTSKPADGALDHECSVALREALCAEICDELAALKKYEAQHGSYPELVRAHYSLPAKSSRRR